MGDFKTKLKENFENEILEQCHSAEKGKRWTPWDYLTFIVLQKIETNEGETLWWNPKKTSKKVAVCRKGNWKTPR